MKKPRPQQEDAVNLRILECLAAHGRMPYAQVAEKLRLSPNAVRDRILSMERRGVIVSYHAIVDPQSVGYRCHALALMHPGPRADAAIQAAIKHPSVLEVQEASGRFGLIVEVVARDEMELHDILDGLFYEHGYELAQTVDLGAPIGRYKAPSRDESVLLEVAL